MAAANNPNPNPVPAEQRAPWVQNLVDAQAVNFVVDRYLKTLRSRSMQLQATGSITFAPQQHLPAGLHFNLSLCPGRGGRDPVLKIALVECRNYNPLRIHFTVSAVLMKEDGTEGLALDYSSHPPRASYLDDDEDMDDGDESSGLDLSQDHEWNLYEFEADDNGVTYVDIPDAETAQNEEALWADDSLHIRVTVRMYDLGRRQ